MTYNIENWILFSCKEKGNYEVFRKMNGSGIFVREASQI